MDFKLTAENLTDIELYKDFKDNVLINYARQMDTDESTDLDLLKKAREYRIQSIPFDKKYGGLGKGFLSAILCMEELSKVCPAFPGIYNVCEVVGSSIDSFGTDEQKEKYLTKIASGESIAAFAITEASAGSDSASAKTTAAADGDCYVINGTKLFITNSELADIFLIGAQCDVGEGRKKISMFIVEKGTPGFVIGKAEHKMGIRSSSTCELILDNVRVPKENLLGTYGKGLSIALKGLDGGRVQIAAQGLGIAEGCIEILVDYLKSNADANCRKINNQAIQFEIVDMQTRIEAAKLLTYRAACLWDTGEPFSKEAAMAKLFATALANEIARTCFRLMGPEAGSKKYLMEALLRDAKVTEIYEGTNEIQKLVISGLMGLSV